MNSAFAAWPPDALRVDMLMETCAKEIISIWPANRWSYTVCLRRDSASYYRDLFGSSDASCRVTSSHSVQCVKGNQALLPNGNI